MNKLVFLITMVFFLGCRPSKKAVKIDHVTPIKNDELNDSILLSLVNSKILEYPSSTQFGVAVVNNGSPKYYGVINRNGVTEKINNRNSVFEIGSMTKVFTSYLLAEHVIEGKLKLDDRISDIVKINLNNSLDFSLKQLASHSSGLPVMPESFFNSGYDEDNPYKDFKESELINYLTNEMSVDTSTVNKFSYSNVGISILGYLLEQKNNRSYENLIAENILTPLEMSNTSLSRLDIREKLIGGLKLNGNQGKNWDLEAIKPAGGLYSTPKDLVSFLLNCLNKENKIFALQSEQILIRNKSVAQGLGWMIINSKSGKKFYFHAGATGVYSSIFVLDPEDRNAIILLTNIETGENSIDPFGFKLMKELNNLN